MTKRPEAVYNSIMCIDVEDLTGAKFMLPGHSSHNSLKGHNTQHSDHMLRFQIYIIEYDL